MNNNGWWNGTGQGILIGVAIHFLTKFFDDIYEKIKERASKKAKIGYAIEDLQGLINNLLTIPEGKRGKEWNKVFDEMKNLKLKYEKYILEDIKKIGY